jgi:hypothetical protein
LTSFFSVFWLTAVVPLYSPIAGVTFAAAAITASAIVTWLHLAVHLI